MGILEEQAIIVTGAGRGLGEAFAIHAAQAGARVVVNDIDEEMAEKVAATIAEFGGIAVPSGHSVADPQDAERIVQCCVREFGTVNGLVNNAAVNYEALPWLDEAGRMRELIETNVLGSMYTGTAAIRAMREHGGAVVNICSGAFFGQRKLAGYAASKGAIASLTYSWALDCEESGIRVNAVCPLAHTRMVWQSERALRNCPPSNTPARIAPVVLHLLSSAAEGITGQVIRCNGTELHVVGGPFVKQPVLRRDCWDSAGVAKAFDEVFSAHLEPYGLEKRQPPRLRRLIAPLESA
ncbi:MAG: SDR family NAD(P)-dependent oxidoreductase [Sciscionella sp.]